MSSQIYVVFLMLTTCQILHAGLCKTLNVSVKSDGQGLKYIGTVNHRSYFAEGDKAMNWADAQLYCNESGLQLASIETIAHVNFLNVTLPLYFPTVPFWTSGREDHSADGFVWDINGFKANADVLDDWHDCIGDKYGNCIYLVTFSDKKMYTAALQCKNNNYALCQS